MSDQCKDCKFFDEDDQPFGANSLYRRCHRYPATVNKEPTDWCGEYDAEDEAP